MCKIKLYNRIATSNNNYSSIVDNLYTTSIVQGAERSQTTVFNDGSAQWHVAYPSGEDDTRNVAIHDNLNLKEFFERPVYAANYSWSPASATPFFQVFDPWSVFFNNPRVANRISNYNLLHCKLRVKIMVSGNSFYYGRLLAHYDPLGPLNKTSNYSVGTSTASCIQASQGLHAFVDPTESQGCEFTLPFIWFNDTLSLPDGDLVNMGRFYLRQLQFLKHANASTDPVNISVFLWAEDVKVSIPTTNNIAGITSQSGDYDDAYVRTQGDEYGTGVISSVASAVASKAGSLSTAPMIGKYAKATQIASGAMSDIAKMFGFSRPVCLAETMNMKPALVGQLAATNVTDMSTKLTVDAKQELTIDPSVIGINAPDELSLTYLASRESYLTQFPWTIASTGGALLWEARVTPVIYDYIAPFYYLPACAYTALPFTHWRGTMRYRFQIVASAFHKGRLAIAWDPYSMNGTIQPNITYTRIVDLASERDVIVDIPWGSSSHYLNTLALSTVLSFTTTGHYPANTISTNGSISVTVLNELSSPSALVNNDININVFVCMCEDAEFAVPNERIAKYSLAPTAGVQTQADDYDDTGNDPQPIAPTEKLEPCLPMSDASNLVYFGEKISSFRQLLKRFTYHSSMLADSALTGLSRYLVPNFPQHRGYYISGLELNGVNRVNPVNNHFINYLAVAFIAARGGIRWKVYAESSAATVPGVLSVVSFPYVDVTTPIKFHYAYDYTTSLAFASNRVLNNPIGSTGMVITPITQQPCVEFEVPYCKSIRFDNPRWPSGRSTFGNQTGGSHSIYAAQPAGNCSISRYVAAAEDFTLIGFQGCPPITNATVL